MPVTVLGDFWMYDTRSLAWTELASAGAPAARFALGLVAVRSKLYLHGGTLNTGTALQVPKGPKQASTC